MAGFRSHVGVVVDLLLRWSDRCSEFDGAVELFGGNGSIETGFGAGIGKALEGLEGFEVFVTFAVGDLLEIFKSIFILSEFSGGIAGVPESVHHVLFTFGEFNRSGVLLEKVLESDGELFGDRHTRFDIVGGLGS